MYDLIPEHRWLWRGGALALILAASALRIAYLAGGCPLDLAPDEAHYWDWSRNLDWNYYSKGPLVAWLIHGSCALFGDWSVRMTGTEVAALRLPAVACGALLLAALYVLTVQVWRRERLAFGVVALTLTVPAVSACSILMTIDAPFLCLWAWALVTGHCALVQGRAWAWPVTGLLVALGILAKYTMALWVVSAGLFLLFTPEFRPLLWRAGFWVMSAIANLASVPVLLWNAEHDWVTFRHVAKQAGVSSVEGGGIRWLGPIEYIGGQFALMLGFWLVAWIAAMIAFRPRRDTSPALRYLWWMSVPTFILFWLVSIKTKTQVNWPAAGYLSGVMLTAVWVERQWRSSSAWTRRLVRASALGTCVIGLGLTAILHAPGLLQPLADPVAGPPSASNPFPIRKIDPSCRLRGWAYLASEVDHLRGEIALQESREPVLAGTAWPIPGELGFYCAGHPTAYSVGAILGDRYSQYDLWRPNPIDDAQAFGGRTFVIVGQGLSDRPLGVFAEPAAPRHVIYREDGQPVAGWTIWVCRDFRGISAAALRQVRRGF